MTVQETEKMRSVNVQLTDEVIQWIDARGAGSRSEAARVVIAAILAAGVGGDDAPHSAAIDAARRTSPEIRNAVSEAGLAVWHKAIIWVPERMETEIILALRDEEGALRVSDFIRGALFGASGQNPAAGLSRAGHEFWAGSVETAGQD